MKFNMSAFRHPKEKAYGTAMLVIGSLFWLLLVSIPVILLLQGQIQPVLVLLAYGFGLWFVFFAIRALTRAYMFGHYVKVGPTQFPHLQQAVEAGAAELGLKEVPITFVYNSSGVMNAMALKLVGRHRYIWLTSALLDADDDDQVSFVIGHELGHHVAGHLDEPWQFLRMPAWVVPLLGPAYSRGRELTCDRIGAFVCRNPKAARSALQMLACGSARLNGQMNSDAFAEQEKMVPPIAGFLLHIFSGYPRLTKRVVSLSHWYAVGSNPARETLRAQPQLA